LPDWIVIAGAVKSPDMIWLANRQCFQKYH
jgi:hypothetical protein